MAIANGIATRPSSGTEPLDLRKSRLDKGLSLEDIAEKTKISIRFLRAIEAEEYETLPGLKKPDYVIPHASGKCIVEVKQIEDSDPRPTHGFNPDRPVRAKIRRASGFWAG